MKTVVKERNLERSGNFQENTFQIKANGKAFKILSDGLYSDKIKAIIRELSCNAYDAHIEAGTQDVKFDVHIPNGMSPIFYIRDYGTGLSKEDIETVYTTYFESTKTDTNDAIGCLGLGSKSPFSYVNMFTVTSFYDGMQYAYSAILNEHGTPAIVLINESETDEKNGLKVQFAVKKCDFNEFAYKAEDVFSYFKSFPKILGRSIKEKEPAYVVKKDSWGILDSYYGRNATAIMGNVAYPINLDKADLSHEEEQILQKLSVDLFFPIGDLEVAASRESLSYDERTTNAIRNRVQDIIKSERERIVKELANEKCYWDAVAWVKKEKTSNKVANLLLANTSLKYKDREIKENVYLDKEQYQEIDKNFWVSVSEIKQRWDTKDYRHKKTVGKRDGVVNVHINTRCALFVNDCKNRQMSRIRKYVNDNKDITSVYVVDASNKESINKFMKDVGILSIKSLSDIELPKVTRKKQSDSAVGYFVKMDWECNGSRAADYWDFIEDSEGFDLDKGGFYVPINRWQVIYEKLQYRPSDLLSTLNRIYKSITPNVLPKVYGIKKAKMGLISKNKKWINWLDFVQESIKTYVLSPDINKKLQVKLLHGHYGKLDNLFEQAIRYDKNKTTKVMESDWMKKCVCSKIRNIGTIYDSRKQDSKYDARLDIVTKFMNSHQSILSKEDLDKINEYNEEYKELIKVANKAYPLIDECYNSFYSRAGIFSILDYINAMTKTKQTKQN